MRRIAAILFGILMHFQCLCQWPYGTETSLFASSSNRNVTGIHQMENGDFMLTSEPFGFASIISNDGRFSNPLYLVQTNGCHTTNGYVVEGTTIIGVSTGLLDQNDNLRPKSFLTLHKVDTLAIDVWNKDRLICNRENGKSNAGVIADESGGFVVYWIEYENGGHRIYAQRTTSNGESLWKLQGLLVNGTNSIKRNLKVNHTPFGYLFTWEDERDGFYKIYGQLLNVNGGLSWVTSGIPLMSGNQPQSNCIMYDTVGRMMSIAWIEQSGDLRSIRHKKLGYDGVSVGNTNGEAVAQSLKAMDALRIEPLLGGHAFFWEDYNTGHPVVRMEFLDSGGVVKYVGEGTAMTLEEHSSLDYDVSKDHHGGLIVVWMDDRDDIGDIYMQHIDSSLALVYADTAKAVNTEKHLQKSPHVMVDKDDRLVVVWTTLGSCRANLVEWTYDKKTQVVDPEDPGVEEYIFLNQNSTGQLSLYPNPIFREELMIHGISVVDSIGALEVEVYNESGQLIERQQFDDLRSDQNVSIEKQILPGVYHFCFTRFDFTECKKVIVLESDQ